MAIEHILTDNDTVDGLALKYNVLWTDIVDFNNLEYPYIIPDQQTAYNTLYAQGYATLTRVNTQTDLTLYAGSTFLTHGDVSGFQKSYVLVDDLTIPAGTATGYAFIRSEVAGTYGNVIANTISVVGSIQSNQGSNVQLTVNNAVPFTNGRDARVLMTGQSILIPTSVTDTMTGNIGSFLNVLGGEDLELTSEGLLDIDGFGDVSSVIGLDNIKQAVRDRLSAELSSLTNHPEYGSGIVDLVGKFGLPNVLKRIELEVHQAMAYEDRIEKTVVNAVEISETAVMVDLILTIASKTINTSLLLDF